jgi:hypothetical protein
MNDIDFCGKFPPEIVVSAINNSDVNKARFVWRWVREELKNKYQLKDSANPFQDTCLKLIDTMVEEGLHVLGDDMYKNWKLKKRIKNYVAHIGTLPGWESGAGSMLERWKKHKAKLEEEANKVNEEETKTETTEETTTDA